MSPIIDMVYFVTLIWSDSQDKSTPRWSRKRNGCKPYNRWQERGTSVSPSPQHGVSVDNVHYILHGYRHRQPGAYTYTRPLLSSI